MLSTTPLSFANRGLVTYTIWGNTTGSWVPQNSVTFQDTKPSPIRTKRVEGWRPMTDWSRSLRMPDGLWVLMVGVGAIRGAVEGNAGHQVSIVNPRPAYLGYPSSFLEPDFPEDRELLLKALLKIKDQNVNLLMVAQGAKSTLDTIASRMNVMRLAVRAMKRGQVVKTFNTLKEYARANGFRQRAKYYRAKNRFERAGNPSNAKALAKETSSLWLETNFCFLQLAADIKGSVEELERPPDQPFIHGRSGAHVEQQSDEITSSHVVAESVSFSYAVRFKAFRRDVHYVHLAYRVDNSWLLQLSRVGLTNPLALAYDVMPWTWVFDWVLPLGKWINALDATVGLTFVDGAVGRIREEGFHVLEAKPNHQPSVWTNSGSFSAASPTANTQFVRTVIGEPKLGDLVPPLRSPFKDPLWKIATTAALIGQRKG